MPLFACMGHIIFDNNGEGGYELFCQVSVFFVVGDDAG
jgi:hypothetical protein